MRPTELTIIIIVAAVVLYAGYIWGFNVGKKEAGPAAGQLATPTPGIDTGYQNPFEGVKLNPFR